MDREMWLTVPEAARRVRCGERVIYDAVAAGALRAARIGGRRLVRTRPEWVDDWLERLAADAPEGPREATAHA